MNAVRVLLGQRARRDRAQLTVWILGTGLLAVFSAVAVADTYGDAAERASILKLAVANPSILMLRGLPAGGGVDAFVFFEIFTYFALLAGLMSTFLAVRHTRAEEETGRAELIASTPAARTSATVATLLHGFGANLALGVAVAVGMIAGGLDGGGSLLTGAATVAAGVAFVAVGVLAAQFMRTSRGANGVAAGLVGVAFLLRGVGDALGTPSADGESMTSAWPSWLSPIGWAQHTAAYTANDPTPLLLCLALAAACTAAVFALQARRDTGASILPARSGRRDARPWLASTTGLVWRLQWPTIVGWCIGGVALGLLAGTLAPLITEAAASGPAIGETLDAVVRGGAGEDLAETLVSAMFSIGGVLAAACGVQAVVRMRQEEAAGTVEPVLATPVSRRRWLADYLVVGIVAIVLILGSAAVSSTLGGAMTGDDLAAGSFASAAAQLPAALLYLGIGSLVFVLVPALTVPVVWGLVGLGVALGIFGGLIGLPEWALDASPFSHTPVVLGTDPDWSGGFVMLALALVAATTAVVAVRFRELRVG